jgi:hypothetical protein
MDNIVSEVLEFGMIACFGAAWPISIHRSVKSRTTKGKSFVFLLIVLVGYIFGIARKVFMTDYYIAFYAYCFNFMLVAVDSALWLYNYHRYDKNP